MVLATLMMLALLPIRPSSWWGYPQLGSWHRPTTTAGNWLRGRTESLGPIREPAALSLYPQRPLSLRNHGR